MVRLTEREKELMRWAHESFSKPWFSLVDAMGKLHAGQKLDNPYIHPYFIDYPLDARVIYKLLRTTKIIKLLIGSNATLFTIILSEDEKRIIWACVEKEEDGVYTDWVKLDVSESWADDAIKLIWQGEWEKLKTYLQNFLLKKEINFSIGALKIANILFFDRVRWAYKSAEDGKNVPLFLINFALAVKDILDRKYIFFWPDVNLFKLLKAVHPVLKSISPYLELGGRIASWQPINDFFVNWYLYINWIIPKPTYETA